MSYCRWSTDNFGCDLYCYEGDQGFVTHVAAVRLVGEVPPAGIDMIASGSVESFRAALASQRAFLDTAERIPIAGPFDGRTFIDPSLKSFRARLLALRDAGYRFPDRVLTAVNEEIAKECSTAGLPSTSLPESASH